MTARKPLSVGKRLAAGLMLSSSLVLTNACTKVVNPATGEVERTAMSPEQERAVGKEQHPKILQQFGGNYDDAELQAYVTEIGERLQAVSELPDEEFTFTLLNSDVVNAFALPGGYVYISRGLMALAENEAEVAGVLAHEIGHVTARHSAQRYTSGQWAQGGVLLGTLAGAILGGEAGAKAAQQFATPLAQGVLAGYSRDQEFQSDQLGVRYLTRAGYDPVAMATFLEKLGNHSQLARKLAGREGEPDPSTSWFATHPRTPDRVKRAAEEAAATAKDGKIGKSEYLRKIDGMIYGDDPSQGFVRGQTFIHPELGFSFVAPPGYRLQNTPSKVLAADKAGRSMTFDGGRIAPNMSMRDYIAGTWAKELNIKNLSRINSFKLDDLPAVSASTTGRTKDGRSFDVGLAAIKVDQDRVYRFVFVYPGRAGEAQAIATKETVESFKKLTPAEAASYKPKRIKVIEVGSGDSRARLADQMAVDNLREEQFSVLNGLEGDEQLRGGMLIKLITE